MNEHEQRIALAEWYGFKNIHEDEVLGLIGTIQDGRKDPGMQIIPRYSCDLDACHTLEEKLTPSQWIHYNAHLIFKPGWTGLLRETKEIIHLTGIEKSTAMCKTLFPWKW